MTRSQSNRVNLLYLVVVSRREGHYQGKRFIKENLQESAAELQDFLSAVGHIWSIVV